MYLSFPPISSVFDLSPAIFWLNEASKLHFMHTAVSLMTLSAFGTSLRMFPKGSRIKFPSKAATMTIFPLEASLSQNRTISGKNCPSSIPIQSYKETREEASDNRSHGYAA